MPLLSASCPHFVYYSVSQLLGLWKLHFQVRLSRCLLLRSAHGKYWWETKGEEEGKANFLLALGGVTSVGRELHVPATLGSSNSAAGSSNIAGNGRTGQPSHSIGQLAQRDSWPFQWSQSLLGALGTSVWGTLSYADTTPEFCLTSLRSTCSFFYLLISDLLYPPPLTPSPVLLTFYKQFLY